MMKWNGDYEPLTRYEGSINVSPTPPLHSQPLFKDPLPHQEAEPPQTHCCLPILKVCFRLSFFQRLLIAQPQASCVGEAGPSKLAQSSTSLFLPSSLLKVQEPLGLTRLPWRHDTWVSRPRGTMPTPMPTPEGSGGAQRQTLPLPFPHQ